MFNWRIIFLRTEKLSLPLASSLARRFKRMSLWISLENIGLYLPFVLNIAIRRLRFLFLACSIVFGFVFHYSSSQLRCSGNSRFSPRWGLIRFTLCHNSSPLVLYGLNIQLLHPVRRESNPHHRKCLPELPLRAVGAYCILPQPLYALGCFTALRVFVCRFSTLPHGQLSSLKTRVYC